MEKRILLVGGGSGGHVYPLIAVAKSLKEIASRSQVDLKLMMLGEGNFLERAAKESNIPFKKIIAGKLRRYSSLETFIDILKVPLSFVQSLWHIFLFMPDAVFTKGGYASFMPAMVASLFLIPVFIHESDSVPGLSNMLISKFATKVFLSFKTAEKYFEEAKVIFTGNPVRKELFRGDKDAARVYFNLREPRPTVLILGGSQGAKMINDVVLSSLVVMAQKFNIIHQCGESQHAAVKKDIDTILTEGTRQYAAPVEVYYRLYPFLDQNQLASAYALADIIVSRAGAGTLFEIAQAGKPAVIVPISQSPANHQYLNAFEFSLSGGYLMEESNFNRESLIRGIELLLNPETYAKVSEKIRTFATPDAADIIAAEILRKS
ncbi:MAG: UDP-N-acetylglucosamine--N-acetylmuramyl-(pentapeptide) pyrophosphoryl-undecaprenol N-acetylglucosamine transferase [Candidatus Taylorbacteria bacterium]|nr:UDP-N-acetylglucosamine--N-acetylmuramyl-(pentapeptide) pyrophosphoryl-undecaprenol N-acetylglucosamine transferase [Candidatus Taylorbacteria bacterium]